MYSAIAEEPTKLTADMPGWWRMASTAALSPLTTLKTPSGNPASLSSAAIRMPAEGEGHPRPGQRRGRRPVREGGGRGLARGVDLAGIGEGDPPRALARRRVEDVAEAAAGAGDDLAAHEMVHRLGHCPLHYPSSL